MYQPCNHVTLHPGRLGPGGGHPGCRGRARAALPLLHPPDAGALQGDSGQAGVLKHSEQTRGSLLNSGYSKIR